METGRKKTGVIFIVAILLVSLTAGILWNGQRNVSYAKEVFLDTETLVQDKIQSNQSFTILEIVSDMENARIGYLAGGCEPVLLPETADKLEAEELLTKDKDSAVEYPLIYTIDVQEFPERNQELLDAGYVETIVSGGDTGITGNSLDEVDESGETENTDSEPESDPENSDGESITVSGNSDSARVAFIADSAVPLSSGTTVSDGSSLTSDDGTIYRYEKAIFTNQEYFKKYVLGMQSGYDRLSLQVITKTADQVTEADIAGADLIYVSGLGADEYQGKDFSEAAAKALLSQVTGEVVRKPCILDYAVYTTTGAVMRESNLYKVCLVLLGENAGGVYEDIAGSFSESVDDPAWQPVINAQVIDNGGHFVRENIYWYTWKAEDFVNPKGTGSSPYFVGSDLASYFSVAAVGTGFSSVVDAIDAENYNNSINNPGRESMDTGSITPALAVQYILKYDTEAAVLYKDSVRILELQPCKDYKFGDAAGKKELIEKWLPDFKDKPDAVQVTCMTIAEFIGHNENISEKYDLIYIGSNTGKFNTWSGNVDVGGIMENRTYRRFNDASMNGMLYSHVGDYGNVQYWGLIKTDYSFLDKTMYRFPGNDLTTYKLAELKEFLSSGSPIIVADDFFTYGGSNSVTASGAPTAINGGREVFKGDGGASVYGILDTSSYMYQLVVYAVHGKDAVRGDDIYGSADWAINWSSRSRLNFFYESGADARNLLSFINQQKLYLNLTTRPAEYTYTTTGANNHIVSATYLQPESDGNYYLNYEFSISSLGVATAGQSFDCQLFIDVNNDGKFSKTQEEMDSLIITEIATGNVVARASDGYHLRAGVAYRMRRALPNEYMGCIAWELLCTANNNDNIHAAQTGYTVVKKNSEEKQELRILQITSGYSTGTNPTGGLNANNLNLQQELENGTTVWGELLANVPDFELNITTIPTYGDDGLVARFKADNNLFDRYDMLIFGFGDGFADIRYEPLLDAITEYANSGHCILFAHDTTFVQTSQLDGYYDYSRPNNEGGKQVSIDRDGNTAPFVDLVTWWGEYEEDKRPRFLTQLVRNLGGMDPYGVTVNGSAARSGESISKGTAAWNELVASGKDIAFKPNTYQTQTVANTQGATYIQLRENIFWTPEWGQPQVNRLFSFNVDSSSFFRGLHTQDYGYNGNQLCSTVVGKVNDGMITNYPYKIPDSFLAANTHAQYWALDLESDSDKDGESDLVVWYTINEITTGDNNVYSEDLCSISPYDARNNYYIYNMGNITYTGVGHTAVTSEQEVKLFINTMVASYVASIKNPSVRIVEDGSSAASEISNISVPFLENGTVLTDSANNDVVRVYFRVFDNNIVKGTKTITGNFYINGEQIKLSIYDVAGNKLYDAGSTEAANVLHSGNSYYVEVPASRLGGRNAADFKVEVFTDWIRNGTQVQSGKVSDTVTISKIELFDLD